MSDLPSSHRSRHKANRRAVLLRQAAEAIANGGIHTTSMDQVAEHAGIKKMILYRYFGSKNNLVHAILEDLVTAILEADAEPVKRWTERLEKTLAVIRERSAAMKLLVRYAAHDPEFGPHFARIERVLIERSEARIGEMIGESQPLFPVRVLSDAITGFLMSAYVIRIEQADAFTDRSFLNWVTGSVQGMTQSALPRLP